MLLKKNLCLNGFMGPIGIMRTQQAYEEQSPTQNRPKTGGPEALYFRIKVASPLWFYIAACERLDCSDE